MRLAAALALALGAAHPAAAAGTDALKRLEADPSAAASARLKRLLSGAKDADQRFWLVRALGVRLKEHSDEAALEALLAAASDPAPLVRGSAVRNLAGFEAVPAEAVRGRWLGPLEGAARKAEADASPLVRDGARELRRALEAFRDPSARGAPPPPEEDSAPRRSRLARALGIVWLLVLPLSGALWLASGRPVFDLLSAEGRRASAAARELRRRPGLAAACAVLWLGLAALLVGWGFELVVALLGRPEAGSAWGAAYLAGWFCLAAPGAFAAAAVAREPRGGGLGAALEGAPQAALLALASALVLGPLGLLYKAFWRAGRRRPPAAGTFKALLEEGPLRAAARAAAEAAEEGSGLVFALGRAPAPGSPRLAMTAYDPRFALLAAAPATTVLCALAAASSAAEWTASRGAVLLGCTLWAWSVLAGVLCAVLGALEGVAAGARHRVERGLEVPPALSALIKEET